MNSSLSFSLGMRCLIKKAIASVAILGASLSAQSVFAQAPKMEDVASLKALQSTSAGFKRSLRLPTGEFSLGDDAGKVTASSLQTTYKLDATAFTPGLVTLCPPGSEDNKAMAGCKIVGINNSYPVNANNVDRWVSEVKSQLIGNSNWFMSPENQSERSSAVLRLAGIFDQAFAGCIMRLTQVSESSAESCFKTKDNNERIALYLKLCRSSINGIRGDLIVTAPDNGPDFCAIDPKSGIATTLTFDQRNSRMGVAIMSILPIIELATRSDIIEQRNQQQNFKPPGRL